MVSLQPYLLVVMEENASARMGDRPTDYSPRYDIMTKQTQFSNKEFFLFSHMTYIYMRPPCIPLSTFTCMLTLNNNDVFFNNHGHNRDQAMCMWQANMKITVK